MACPNPLFRILDDGSGGGVAPGAFAEGDAPGAGNGLIGFSFVDASGNLVLPQLDSSGAIPVTTESAGDCKHARGALPAGSATNVEITGAKITLTADAVYTGIGVNIASTVTSHFQLIWNDDGTETVLWDGIVGPGQYTVPIDYSCLEVTAGSTGTQELLIKGMNLDTVGCMYAFVEASEVN